LLLVPKDFYKFPIQNTLKQRHALWRLLFNFPLDYAIRNALQIHEGMELIGTHKLMVKVDEVNILAENTNTIKKNTEALLCASGEVDRQVNTEKSKCMIVSSHQNVDQITIH
jgi:hypothetical protein